MQGDEKGGAFSARWPVSATPAREEIELLAFPPAPPDIENPTRLPKRPRDRYPRRS
jgi:hypothetical protein